LVFTLKPVLREQCYLQKELDSALKSVKAKKNLLILGPANIGKSSFLLNLKESIEKSKQTKPVIFSAEKCIDLIHYIKNNTLNTLNEYPDVFKEPKELFSLSMLDLDKRISDINMSESAKHALKLLLIFEHDPKANLEEVIRTLFEFPHMIAAETKASSVILVDDAELLSTIKSDKVSASFLFELLKSQDMESVFVLASSLHLPLEGFEELTLRPLDIEETRTFLTSHELELAEDSLTKLYNFAEGVPFYINYFGRLLQYTTKTDSDSISQLLDDSLSNELHIYFTEKLKSLSPKELPILFCMAEHNVNTPSRISKLLNYSQTNVRRFLSIMEEKGFVTLKERGVFTIHDPVFRKWLEHQTRS
jgi:hypothetical protein